MTLPAITHYFYRRSVHDADTIGDFTSFWAPPSGNTVDAAPAGLVFYGLLFGEMTSVTPVDDWTPVTSGSVGGSNFYLFRRETEASEPGIYYFDFDPPIVTDAQQPVAVGFGVAGSAWDIAGTPQFDIGNTATSDALTMPPAGDVLSVHIWGGVQSPWAYEPWTPNTTDFPSNRRFGYAGHPQPRAATIGEIRNAATAPGKAATITADGSDTFAIQFLFSDVPVALGGWGVGFVRMGAN